MAPSISSSPEQTDGSALIAEVRVDCTGDRKSTEEEPAFRVDQSVFQSMVSLTITPGNESNLSHWTRTIQALPVFCLSIRLSRFARLRSEHFRMFDEAANGDRLTSLSERADQPIFSDPLITQLF